MLDTNLRVLRRGRSGRVLGGHARARTTALRGHGLILRIIQMHEILRVQKRIDQHNPHNINTN